MTDVIVAQPVKKELQVELKKAITNIDKKIKSLGGDATYVFKGSVNFRMNELDSNTINIQSTQDLIYLGKALAKMKRVEKEYNEVMESLKLDSYPVCNWYGQAITIWIEDLTYVTRRLANQVTINELTKKRAELVQYLSADEKLGNILTELKTLMK